MTTHKFFKITCSIFLVITLFIQSCKKDAGIAIVYTPRSDTALTVHNTAPVVNAGANMEVFLPADSTLLTGSVYDKENNIANYSWKKLTGPAGGSIDNPDSLTTKVHGLKVGEYSFELTVTDLLGLQGRDTVTLYVIEILGPNEVIFKNLVWFFPWEATLEIKNIYNYIPVGKPIKVVIRRDNTFDWKEVFPDYNIAINYGYSIDTTYGNLYIYYYGPDPDDTPDVKIKF